MFKYSDKEIERLIKAVYNGKISPRKLPKTLYIEIAEHLKAGLYKGFGESISSLKKGVKARTSGIDKSDLQLLAELRSNIYIFSAAKTYQQVREMTGAIIGNNGTVTPYNEFKAKAKQIFKTYNEDYLRTEYNTALGQAQNAVKWNEIWNNRDVLPMLKYDAILDMHTSDICRPLNGIVAPVNDPIWRKIMPLNHFNCRCIVKQLGEDAKPSTDSKKSKAFKNATGQMQDVFKMNAGIDGYVFKKDHPYFTVPKSDKEFAKQNFGLKIPKNDN